MQTSACWKHPVLLGHFRPRLKRPLATGMPCWRHRPGRSTRRLLHCGVGWLGWSGSSPRKMRRSAGCAEPRKPALAGSASSRGGWTCCRGATWSGTSRSLRWRRTPAACKGKGRSANGASACRLRSSRRRPIPRWPASGATSFSSPVPWTRRYQRFELSSRVWRTSARITQLRLRSSTGSMIHSSWRSVCASLLLGWGMKQLMSRRRARLLSTGLLKQGFKRRLHGSRQGFRMPSPMMLLRLTCPSTKRSFLH
mmetsp:Transcript_2895/g.8051  ORF Transcript_2895/g.8051 Transcript_2895/m.8051 type:complete len:253 (-) Transcript_2895:528-1286(-)